MRVLCIQHARINNTYTVLINMLWSTYHGQRIMVNMVNISYYSIQDAYRHMAAQGLKFPVTVITAAGDTLYLHMRYDCLVLCMP